MVRLAIFTLLTCTLVVTGQQEHYCRFSSDHELCDLTPPSREECGLVLESGVNAELQRVILDEHNVLRNSAAAGKLRDGNLDGFLPEAANMMELVSGNKRILKSFYVFFISMQFYPFRLISKNAWIFFFSNLFDR